VAQASIERWFTPGFVEANPDTVAKLRATLADTPPEGYAGCCDAIAGMDLLDAIESVQAPTLVIAGRQDPATPPAHAERIAERIHGSRLELVDAAHLANIELADSVTALTLAHLEGR
jgi:3-oxoadipate enol-lactonase